MVFADLKTDLKTDLKLILDLILTDLKFGIACKTNGFQWFLLILKLILKLILN